MGFGEAGEHRLDLYLSHMGLKLQKHKAESN